jgi:hypothetical protein
MARGPAAATRHPSQFRTLLSSAVYTLVGLLSLVVTGFGDFGAKTDTALLGVAFNPLITWCIC